MDPNSAPLRALPREERDLFIAAMNAHLLAFDNVSHIPPWLADAFCRLATGGGFATGSSIQMGTRFSSMPSAL